MDILAVINVIFECCFIFWSVLLSIALVIYAVKSAISEESDEAEQTEAEWKAACEADDKFMKRIDGKLDILLKLYGCEVYEDTIVRPTHNVFEKLTDISDKLAVLLCGPLDEETLKELKAEREANKSNEELKKHT